MDDNNLNPNLKPEALLKKTESLIDRINALLKTLTNLSFLYTKTQETSNHDRKNTY